MNVRRAFVAGVCLGIAVALGIWMHASLTDQPLDWTRILLWPGSLLLFAGEPAHGPMALPRLAVAIFSNGLLYGLPIAMGCRALAALHSLRHATRKP